MQSEWKDTYKIGITEIDQTHEHLFALFNEFVDLCRIRAPMQTLLTKYHDLITYVEDHFIEEEHIMLQRGYADFDNHKNIHTHLINDAKEVEKDLVQAKDGDDLLPYIDCLQSLIIEHILHKDSQITHQPSD